MLVGYSKWMFRLLFLFCKHIWFVASLYVTVMDDPDQWIKAKTTMQVFLRVNCLHVVIL